MNKLKRIKTKVLR